MCPKKFGHPLSSPTILDNVQSLAIGPTLLGSMSGCKFLYYLMTSRSGIRHVHGTWTWTFENEKDWILNFWCCYLISRNNVCSKLKSIQSKRWRHQCKNRGWVPPRSDNNNRSNLFRNKTHAWFRWFLTREILDWLKL